MDTSKSTFPKVKSSFSFLMGCSSSYPIFSISVGGSANQLGIKSAIWESSLLSLPLLTSPSSADYPLCVSGAWPSLFIPVLPVLCFRPSSSHLDYFHSLWTIPLISNNMHYLCKAKVIFLKEKLVILPICWKPALVFYHFKIKIPSSTVQHTRFSMTLVLLTFWLICYPFIQSVQK